jgi:Ca-activated chloride channel family protein
MPKFPTLPSLAAGLLGALLAGSSPVLAAEPVAVAIVFDGSGSMWGKLGTDPNPTHVTAREALRQALSAIDRSTLVGMTVLGHRRPGDCTDVELMLPLAPVDAERITGPLVKLNPKGRGPLALALRRTVQALPGAGPESIVLIHDDPDNCQEDPCAAAAEIHRQKPRLAVHVVSLGMRPEDFERMSCVAKTTGGKWFDAQSTAAAATAIAEALRLASLGTPAPVASLQVPVPKPAERPAEAGPPGLRLAAVLAAGGEPVNRSVRWRIWRGTVSAGEPAAELNEPSPAVALEPGTYTVEARAGLAAATQTVEVRADRPSRLILPLNAGLVQLRVPAFAKSSPTATLSLASFESQVAGPQAALWIGSGQTTELVVPAGTYKVVLEDRHFRSEKVIVVPSGSQGTAVIAPHAGRIHLDARDHRGQAVAGLVLYRILEDDPASASGRREIARSAAAKGDFLLPAGTYHVSARAGAAEVRELVALGSGDEISRTLVLGTARLSLAARLAGEAQPSGIGSSYRIIRMEDDREVARGDGPEWVLELPPGRYLIESRMGDQNAVASREVEIRAGADQSVLVSHAAGTVALRPAGSAAPAQGEAFWEIEDQSGRTVWRAIGAEPRGVLAAGRYVARLETRDRRRERPFEVRAGENAVVEVSLD